MERQAFRRAARSCRRSRSPRDDAARHHSRHRRLHEPRAGKGAGRLTSASDVWAFGCVLYEMLTGRRAFNGEDISDTLAAILRGEPDWSALPADMSLSVRTLLTGCLTKDRRHRVADLSAALFVIDHQAHLSSAAAVPIASAARVPSWRKALLAGTVVIVGLAAGYAGWRLKPTEPRPVTRLAVTLGERDALRRGRRLRWRCRRMAPAWSIRRTTGCICAPSISSMPRRSRAWKLKGLRAREPRFSHRMVGGWDSGRRSN